MTTRFMIIRKSDKSTEAGVMPSEEQLAAMGRHNEELLRASARQPGVGLKPTSKGARVMFSGGKPTVIDGPFPDAKGLVAGFTMIDVESKEEALEWVERWPALDGVSNPSWDASDEPSGAPLPRALLRTHLSLQDRSGRSLGRAAAVGSCRPTPRRRRAASVATLGRARALPFEAPRAT